MLISDADKLAIVATAKQDKSVTQEDFALQYGISPTTVRRILAEARIIEIKSHKCMWEDELIQILKLHGLDNASTLSSFIRKAKLNEQQST